MPGIVIPSRSSDLADRILDRQRYSIWQGERSRMVLSFPTHQEMWDRYADLRRASQREGGRGEEATAYYIANRVAMDEGAAVSWSQRFDEDELSAVQHAMNLRIDRGTRVFDAEFQNHPQPEAVVGLVEDLDADAIAARVSRRPRGAGGADDIPVRVRVKNPRDERGRQLGVAGGRGCRGPQPVQLPALHHPGDGATRNRGVPLGRAATASEVVT